MKVFHPILWCVMIALVVSISVMGPVEGAAAGASVSGSVSYSGAVPNLKPISMDADPVCAAHHSENVMPEVLVLGEGNALANVLVKVKSGLSAKEYPVPTEPVVLDQKGCQYDPHVLGIRVGQELKILNPDGTLHNVHAMSKENPEFNLAMPKFRKEVSKIFETPEDIFTMKCDVHPWMGCWVTVLDHPFFAVTGKDGKFSLEGLDAGTYEIEAWHEKLGTQSFSVTLGDGEAQTLDIVFEKP